MPTLAHNRRTSIKAAIKRASAAARKEMNRLDRAYLQRVDALYKQAADDLAAVINSYADGAGSLRLASQRALLDQINARLEQFSSTRNEVLVDGMTNAAGLGLRPFTGLGAASTPVLAENAVAFVSSLVDNDGLQLSDRLWRLDQHAKTLVGQSVQSAIIKGQSASEAVNDLLSRGLDVPADLLNKAGEANAFKTGRAAINDLLKGGKSPRANALRVFRTELNRAHGEAYMMGGEDTEDFGGWRFLLSPRHPEQDICDMHARVNRYGLGPGVYPSREANPWPAHPNTLSYIEIVFKDEITEEDKAGKLTRVEWLQDQPPSVQQAVLNSRRKRGALIKGILKENEIATPWNVLKTKYERKGVIIDDLVVPPETVSKISSPVFGKIDQELKSYITDAFEHAPVASRKVVDNISPLKSLNVVTGPGSYYMATGRITLDTRHMIKKAGNHSKHDVYRHEFGHHVDFWGLSVDGQRRGRTISSTRDATGGMLDTIESSRKSLFAKSAAQKARRAELIKSVNEMLDLSVADIFGSLTYNKVGYGHSVKYLKRPGFLHTEVFANLFDIYNRKDRAAWQFVEKELPDLTRRFEEVIKELGK